MMTFMWNVEMLIIALLAVQISKWMYQWSKPKAQCSGKLPPGSMGFPVIGETIEFFKPSKLLEIPTFFRKRMQRYGPLFRTNIMGFNMVISTESDVIFEIFREENKSFVLCYPEIFVKQLGKDSLFFSSGNIHKNIKQTTMHLMGSENLKQNIIRSMNQETLEHLKCMSKEGTFNLRDAVSCSIVPFLAPKLISNLKPEMQTKLVDSFSTFHFDWFRSPFALSTWKSIYKSLKAHRELTKMIREVVNMRIQAREKHEDFLGTLLEDLEKEGSIYNKDSVINLILVVFILSKHSTSVSTALTLNFLSKNPKALEELKREHKGILQNRETKEAGLSWEEYRHNMTFTSMVINESLRLSSMGSILFRKAVKDVQVKGGMRQCVGADFSKLYLTIFLHHLVTTYDFSVVQECEINRTPFPCFIKDLLINISPSLPSEPCSSKS